VTNVYWFEQTEADVPTQNDWFSASETLQLNNLRFAKRRTDWRLGRWTAKCAVAIYLDIPRHSQGLSRIEIRPAASGMPAVFVANQPVYATISLSHSGGAAMCAVAPAGTAIGCDLELVEERSSSFLSDFFTKEEQELVARSSPTDRPMLVTLMWSAKESALKALGAGLRLDTRSVVVDILEGSNCLVWHPLRVHYAEGQQTFLGWWQYAGKFVQTLVALPPPSAPTLLRIHYDDSVVATGQTKERSISEVRSKQPRLTAGAFSH